MAKYVINSGSWINILKGIYGSRLSHKNAFIYRAYLMAMVKYDINSCSWTNRAKGIQSTRPYLNKM